MILWFVPSIAVALLRVQAPVGQILHVDFVGNYVAPLEDGHVCAARADQVVVIVREPHLLSRVHKPKGHKVHRDNDESP